MSAYIVHERTMHKCVKALLAQGQSCKDGDQLGTWLYAMNVRAVNIAYPTGEPAQCPPYRYSPVKPTPLETLKALQVLRHQCGEGDVTNEALYQRLEDAIFARLEAIVRALPEYEALPWE